MGLDQYAVASKRGVKRKEIAYWRKHPHLESYMAEVYYDRGGTGQFNCKVLKLDVDLILDLREKVTDRELPRGGGFFWGDDSSDDYRESDLEFCEKALIYLNDGYNVTYTSWW